MSFLRNFASAIKGAAIAATLLAPGVSLSAETPDTLVPLKIAPVEFKPSRNIFKRLSDYLKETNKPKPYKPIDFSIIGGPYYSTDTKFGIGLVGAALYNPEPSDTTGSLMSMASLKGQITTSLYYSIGFVGYHNFPGGRARLDYSLKFSSFPTWYWGIGYDYGRQDDHKTKFKKQGYNFATGFQWEAVPHIYIGPTFELNYVMAKHIKDMSIWGDNPETVTSVGAGVTLQYDSRDCVTEPTRGWNIVLDQRFYPRFLGNSTHSFSSTWLTIAKYIRPWHTAVLATRLSAILTYGSTPWSEMGIIGGSISMRGYYEGRYRDKCAADLTIELRQHIMGRSGMVVWVGTGTVFAAPRDIRWKHLLPNAGVGYRWEFKKNTNVRLDVGFGRGEWGLEFNINEAF